MTKNRFGNGRKMPQAQAHHIAEPPAVSFLSYSDALEIMGSACRLDHSVSIPELGSIFHGSPHTPIGDVQEGIAETYGVRFAWVSTNGTTSLNVLSLMAITSPGDKVLVQRDSHVSAFAPVIHLGLKPVYVCPTYDEELGINMGVTPEQLQHILDHNHDVRAVFLTYPSYFGIATDIAACAQVIQQRGIPLIIDAAHGTYLRFHPDLPLAAEKTEATIITQSTHKTAAALSQGSVVLFNGKDDDERKKLIERFYEAVNQLGFVSTSFSYLIILSISCAVWQLKTQGKDLLAQAIETSQWVRSEINGIQGLHCFGQESIRPGFKALDPLRLTVDVSALGLTGYEVEDKLIKEHKIYPEMASLRHVLFLLTPADDMAAGRRIIKALRTIACTRRIQRAPYNRLVPPGLPPQRVYPRDAFYHPRRRKVPVDEAVKCAAAGQPLVSAETIAAYPPGSALVVVGEEITEEIVEYLLAIKRSGGVLKGASDQNFATIQVLDN